MRREWEWSAVALVSMALLGWLAAGCAAPPATTEQQNQAERRLLAPFLQPTEVGCAELLVEITGNFHANVGQPGVDSTRHQVERNETDEYRETVWTNIGGGTEFPFVVTIGAPGEFTDRGFERGAQTTFTVYRQVRLRVYRGRRELTLNATADGNFIIVREAGGKPRELQQFAVVDGVLRQS